VGSRGRRLHAPPLTPPRAAMAFRKTPGGRGQGSWPDSGPTGVSGPVSAAVASGSGGSWGGQRPSLAGDGTVTGARGGAAAAGGG
jgi:hypothetical protein